MRLAAALVAGFLLVSTAFGAAIDDHALFVAVDGQHAGSAVHIGAGRIVTAAHLFRRSTEASTIFVRRAGGKLHKATIVWVNKKLDVALLKVAEEDATDFPVVPLRCELPAVGERITISGFPGVDSVTGPAPVVTVAGIISSTQIHMSGGWPEAMLTDARIFPGHSGAPVLDSEGHDIGIAVGSVGNYASDNDGDPVFVSDIQVIVPAATVCRLLQVKVVV